MALPLPAPMPATNPLIAYEQTRQAMNQLQAQHTANALAQLRLQQEPSMFGAQLAQAQAQTPLTQAQTAKLQAATKLMPEQMRIAAQNALTKQGMLQQSQKRFNPSYAAIKMLENPLILSMLTPVQIQHLHTMASGVISQAAGAPPPGGVPGAAPGMMPSVGAIGDISIPQIGKPSVQPAYGQIPGAATQPPPVGPGVAPGVPPQAALQQAPAAGGVPQSFIQSILDPSLQAAPQAQPGGVHAGVPPQPQPTAAPVAAPGDGAPLSPQRVADVLDTAHSMAIRKTTTTAMQNQRNYAGTAAGMYWHNIQPKINLISKFAGLAGKGKQTADTIAASLNLGENDPGYIAYKQFANVDLPMFSNEVRRSLGGNATKDETELFQKIANPIVYSSNPKLTMQLFGEVERVQQTIAERLSRSESQQEESLKQEAAGKTPKQLPPIASPEATQTGGSYMGHSPFEIQAYAIKYNMSVPAVKNLMQQRLGAQ